MPRNSTSSDPVLSGGTWENLWPHLLAQSAELASRSGFPASLGAIVLARTCWDAFLSEFAARRGLADKVRQLNFGEALAAISTDLPCTPALDVTLSPWRELHGLNKLRNEIVHYKARVNVGLNGPNALVQLLGNAGAPSPTPAETWERSVINPAMAAWACRVVCDAMHALEMQPARRSTPVRALERAIAAAMVPLTR
jgi:hypothetical protein